MKPRLAGVLLLGMAVLSVTGAEIGNAGMESWEARKEKPSDRTPALQDNQVPAGWSVSMHASKKGLEMTGSVNKDTAVKHSGEASTRIGNASTTDVTELTRWDTSVKPNTSYQVTVWCKGKDIELNKPNASGASLWAQAGPEKGFWTNRQGGAGFMKKGGSFDWTPLSCLFTTRPGDEQLIVSVQLRHAKGSLWVDDLELKEMSPEDLLALEKAERKSKMDPTLWREQYGPSRRQVFSLYCPETDKPAPVLVYIHGGGWLGGDGLKDANRGRFDGLIKRMHAKGIAVAVINYRFSPLPDPVYDAARAIQFLRYNATKYNLDKTRFAATGFSAGATTSLWLALHDDLADPKAADPVLRESTRLSGAVIRGVQSSIDPVTIRKWGIAEAIKHSMICRAAGFNSNKEMDAKYESKKDVYKEFSPITHASKDDPPVRVEARSPLDRKKDYIHHTRFAYEFKKVADQVGLSCDLVLAKQDRSLVPPAKDRNETEFLVRVLTQE
jgi:acetyl esterase/lipase